MRPSSRFAACAGVAVAFVLIGAPGGAVGVADPGGSGGHGDHAGGGSQSDRGDNGGRAADTKPKYGSSRAGDTKPHSGDNGPRSTVGSGRSATASGGTSSDPGGESPAAQEPTPVDESGSTVQPAGPDNAPDPTPAPPGVTFGDGRSSRYEQPVDPPRESGAPAVAPVQASPSEVFAIPPGPSLVDGPGSASAPLPLHGARSDPLTDPLLGLAGLVLLPAAGAVLGYRQAKASQAAGALGRR